MDKNVKCITAGCVGVMTISHGKPSRSKGIVKLNAKCTDCGQHQMSTSKGQALLQKIVNDEPDETTKDNYIEVVTDKEAPKTMENKEIKKNSAIMFGFLLSSAVTLLVFLKIKNKPINKNYGLY